MLTSVLLTEERHNTFLKNSEPIFGRYLHYNGFEAAYEQYVGTSKPDFSLWSDGAPVAYWDVTDRQFTAKDHADRDRLIDRMNRGDPPEVVGGPSPAYSTLHSKLRNKSKQFSGASPVPGMLVIADWAFVATFRPDEVAAALYGWPQLIITFGTPRREPQFTRASDGRMVEPSVARKNLNISAISFLTLKLVNRHRYGLDAFMKDVISHFPNDLPHALELAADEEARLQHSGIDLNLEVPVLDVYLTKGAYHPWPQNLFGKYDRVYEYDTSTMGFRLTVDGLAPLTRTPIPASEFQKDIWALLAQPGFRNE